jgi:hypothetical protein
MDPVVEVALIGGVATVVAAAIAIFPKLRKKEKKSAEPQQQSQSAQSPNVSAQGNVTILYGEKPRAYVAPESVRLQKEEDAKALYDGSRKRYEMGMVLVSEVISADNSLLEAELALSSGRDARVSAYEAALKRAKELQLMADRRIQIGVAPKTESSETRLHRTQIEVGLAGEQSSPGN